MKTPLTRAALKTHFTYGWWKYLTAVLGCLLALNLFFAATQARPKENQKVDLFVYGSTTESLIDARLQHLRADEFPDQAAFDCYVINPATTGGVQTFTTRVALGDGDLLILPRETFESFATQGVLLPLDAGWLEEELTAQGINPENGLWRGPDGERRLYGIPLKQMPVLQSWMNDSAVVEYYLCIRVDNGNEDVVWQVFRRFLQEWTANDESVTRTMLRDTQYN